MLARATVLFAAILAFHAGNARADLYKCVGKDGKVLYQGEPCPTSGTEQKMRTQPGGPSGSGGSSRPMKAGWDGEKIAEMKRDCQRGGDAGFRNSWKRNFGSKPVPEAELASAVDNHCTCIVRRITTSLTLAEFAADPFGHSGRFAADAVNGGECKFEMPSLGN